jgi:hydrogenase-4 component F
MELMIPVLPLMLAALYWVIPSRKLLHAANLASSLLMLALAGWITCKIDAGGPLNHSWFGYAFYLDALSVLVLDTILAVGFMVGVFSVGYLNIELKEAKIAIRQVRLYYSLTYAFIFTMILVVTTQNLGLMWIAIEATTLASAFLVGFYNNKEAIEAAWKYIIICSVGIAFALLGIVLIYYASVTNIAESKFSLNWVYLWDHASLLQSSIVKIAFIFVLLGFGTKVGMAPMHTWLPDAHSQAPAPISALLSGVLLNSALYGIIRILALVNRSLGGNWYTSPLLVGIGLLSMVTAAVFIATQKDYKRLLAYSSIEHMGIITVGLGLYTPLSIFGALYHLLNHAFTKSLLFLASGNVYLKYHTREIARVKGIIKTMPRTGWIFLLGLLAIAGMPPFSIFTSELIIIMAGFASKHLLAAIAFVILVVVICAGIVAKMMEMFFGKGVKKISPGDLNPLGLVVLGLTLVMITIAGWTLPPQLKGLIKAAAVIIQGGK